MFSAGYRSELWGRMADGNPVFLLTLMNSHGVTIQVTNYGAKLVSTFVPNRDGKLDNVVLGYTCLDHYIKGHPYLGATIGRVTNRIGNAKFELDGKVIHLTKNHGENQLHGGVVGFDSLLWNVIESNEQGNIPSIAFHLDSPDGDQGYPGKLSVTVRYTMLNDNSVRIEFTAITDEPTIVNMTNHAYFNLDGQKSTDIYKHKVKFYASNYLESTSNSVPTGKLLRVDYTPLDFRLPKEIGSEINKSIEPIMNTGGYDQFFELDSYKKGILNLMAEVEEPISGRVLQVFSTLPGMQFYSSNFLDTEFPTSNGKVCGKHSAFCIEPSYFPDAPNHPNFSSIRLDVGKPYNETIVYKFLIR